MTIREEFKIQKKVYLTFKIKRKNNVNIIVGKNVQDVLDFWYGCGLYRTPKNTMRFKNDVLLVRRLIRSKIFKDEIGDYKITIEDIKLSIRRFAYYVFDSPHDSEHKKHLKSISIGNFIYNEFSISQMSLFMKFFKLPDVEVICDEHKRITEEFKQLWIKEKYNGIEPKCFSQLAETGFKKATIRLLQFLQNYKRRLQLSSLEVEHPEKCVRYVYNSILKGRHDKTNMRISWLYSDYTYDEVLFEYFINNQMMRRKK